jgi:hypothetical protein
MTPARQQNLLTAVRAPKRGRNGFITSPLIKVLVGPGDNRSELYIHQDNLYDLNPKLTIREVTAYLETVYTKQVAAQEDKKSEFTYICALYAAAEQMLDVQTRNLALQAMYERTRKPYTDSKFRMPDSHCL